MEVLRSRCSLEDSVPALPVCVFTPVWEQFAALRPIHPEIAPTHPLGCHRKRAADRVVFEHVMSALVQGSGDETIASPGCSDRTIRRRARVGGGWIGGTAPPVSAGAIGPSDRD